MASLFDKNNVSSAYLIAIVIIAGCCLFFRLGANRLQSWDEAVYAESAKEMSRDGDWLTPHWNGEKFFQKPPLAIWFTAILFRLFGVSELTARALSALSGMGCVVLVFLIGRRFLSESRAFVAALVLLVTPVFNLYARQGNLDVPLTFWLLVALYAYLKSNEQPGWWLLIGTALGIGGLIKGPAILPSVIAIAIAAVLSRYNVWRVRQFWIGLAVFVVLAASWHIAMISIHSNAFLDQYLGKQIIERSASTLDADAEGPTYYLKAIALGFLPFSLLLPFAAWQYRAVPPVLILTPLVTLILYSLASTKHPWYIVSVYPCFSLAVLSVRRLPIKLFIPLLLVGLWGAKALDDQAELVARGEAPVIAAAQSGTGVLHVPNLNEGPSLLFYTDRKLCLTQHSVSSMAPLAQCKP